jgi:hypothetical protein
VQYRDGIIEAIGNTPLIKLKRASEETGCTILGKAEFMNPGQSVKDRAALFIIRDALNSGRLQPGGTVVEGTAGNTGIGLALVGNALGLKTVIVIPDTQSDEKKDMLRLTGAELIEVPAVPSTITPPGLSVPFIIASFTMKSAARSFTDWPGFMNSALPRISQPVISEACLRRISGVLPIAARESCLMSIANE